MAGRLSGDATVHLRHHAVDCRVGECLGSGGQGEVYRISLRGDQSAEELALKWYFSEWSTPQQWADLDWLTQQEPPNACFLWPIDLATSPHDREFGYVMPLRPPRFHGCTEVVAGRLDISFAALLKACLRLSDAFLSLHARGLCYRDISFGNVFLDPATGDVLIADNDNVAIDARGSVGVRGTDRFMAPEVVRGDAVPSVATDLYSLSVLLFYLLMVSHPLEGRRMLRGDVFSREDAHDLYGRRPVFVFDPEDDSNSPDPFRHRNATMYWSLYPRMLRELFVRAFTTGLHDPIGGRVREGEWRECMARLIDLLVPCGCGVDVFVEPDGRGVAPCWSCSAASPAPLPRLVLDPALEQHVVALPVGRRLFAHHTRRRRFDYRTVEAEVVRHPEAPGVAGLRNLSRASWTARSEAGAPTTVPPGRTIAITAGTSIDFGRVVGVIEPQA
jgi:DNA-binding helix-hairpin-helix protein with protein kinase domain